MMKKISLFAAFACIFFLTGANAISFVFKNNCQYTVWPATQSSSGHPPLSSTGFELGPQRTLSLEISTGWSGRVWARTRCSTGTTGSFSCATGDCATGQISCNNAGGIPPTTLLEFTLSGSGGQDFYDVSLVDGFNLPASVGSEGCNSTSCPSNVNSVCPPELAVVGSDKSVVACKSACLAFNQPQYCCTGDYATPDKCPPTKYSKIFKRECPLAYSYAYDDKTSTFTCKSGANYAITFCP